MPLLPFRPSRADLYTFSFSVRFLLPVIWSKYSVQYFRQRFVSFAARPFCSAIARPRPFRLVWPDTVRFGGLDHVPSQHHVEEGRHRRTCLLYTSPSPRDRTRSRMPSSA